MRNYFRTVHFPPKSLFVINHHHLLLSAVYWQSVKDSTHQRCRVETQRPSGLVLFGLGADLADPPGDLVIPDPSAHRSAFQCWPSGSLLTRRRGSSPGYRAACSPGIDPGFWFGWTCRLPCKIYALFRCGSGVL